MVRTRGDVGLLASRGAVLGTVGGLGPLAPLRLMSGVREMSNLGQTGGGVGFPGRRGPPLGLGLPNNNNMR